MGCVPSQTREKDAFMAVGPGEVKWYTIKKKNKVAIVKSKQKPAGPQSQDSNHERFVLDSASDMESFLTTPVPKSAGTVHCYVVQRGAASKSFTMHLEDGSVFLLYAKKSSLAMGVAPKYSISMQEGITSKDDERFLGSLRSGKSETQFAL
jgi:hypothetical protein